MPRHPLHRLSKKYSGYYLSVSNDISVEVPVKVLIKPTSQIPTMPNLVGSNAISKFVKVYFYQPVFKNVFDVPSEIFLEDGRKIVIIDKNQSFLQPLTKVFGLSFTATIS